MQPEFKDMWVRHLGRVNAVKHRKYFTSRGVTPIPIHSAAYRGRPCVCKFERVKIDKLLKMKDITSAQTERAAPIVFDPKKDVALRFCVYYRKLNSVTVKDSPPLEWMNQRIGLVGDARVFSKLEANSEY